MSKKKKKGICKKLDVYLRRIRFKSVISFLEFIAVLLQITGALFGEDFARHIIEILSNLLGL